MEIKGISWYVYATAADWLCSGCWMANFVIVLAAEWPHIIFKLWLSSIQIHFQYIMTLRILTIVLFHTLHNLKLGTLNMYLYKLLFFIFRWTSPGCLRGAITANWKLHNNVDSLEHLLNHHPHKLSSILRLMEDNDNTLSTFMSRN